MRKVTTACIPLTTVLLLASVIGGSSDGYGLDCSFPIHGALREDCGGLVDRQSLYDEFMNGCFKTYDEESCLENENVRIEMNWRQPQSMLNYTDVGFKKVKAPPGLQKLLGDFWEANQDQATFEYFPYGAIFVNHWDSPTYMASVEDLSLEGAGEELKEAIWEVAQTGIEEWTGKKVRPSSLYGIRKYTTGAILNPHVDRIPLISSCIVNVAQDLDEDWPLEVYDRAGNAINVTMEPFDMVFYESHSLIHGRPFPMKGRYMANIFIHFEAVGFEDDEGAHELEDGRLIPPYILPDSPEVEHWLEEHPLGWSEDWFEDYLDELGEMAARGMVEEIEAMLEVDSRIVNAEDDAGWQPLHEAVLAGELEIVELLIDYGADINARTLFGHGQSPLNIAKSEYGESHPIFVLLQSMDAEDHSNDGTYSEEDFEETDDEYEEDEEGDEL
eukprot:Nitzschia sp. Nitz4//scaffold43_size134323//66673//68223//NITZ4_003301-RA/size134323-processed-gene-0.50-mRNA-1//-1//CDS//3329551954//8885//frame0